jgi:hypothetical protein
MDAGASVRVADDEPNLAVVGGSGPATLMLQFQLWGVAEVWQPGNFAGGMNFSLQMNGSQVLSTSCPSFNDKPAPGYANVFACAPNYPQAGYWPVSVSIPVIFNTAFDLTEQLTVSGSVGISYNGGSESLSTRVSGVGQPAGSVAAVLADYSIRDPNGDPIPGASLVGFTVPEPGAFWLVCLSLIGIFGARRLRNNRPQN